MAEAIMVGGAKFQKTFLDWSKQSTKLFMSVIIVLLLVWITFADKLSLIARWQLSSTLGRLLLLLILYITYILAGWEVAFIFTIAIAITWASRPLLTEGYKRPTAHLLKPVGVDEGYSNMKESKAAPHRWFVEKTLHENPVAVVEDRVDTDAVQDNSSASTTRTSR
jgi:hypothetical protein